MNVSIHRGTKEIGGTCIEVEAQTKRIALDVGLPLDAPDEGHESLLPEVSGFRERDDSLLAILISHPHRDHYGLAPHIRSEVPVYIGEKAHNILRAASRYVPNGHAFSNPRFFQHRVPLQIGPFHITPYLVDHSAFDAYALLIEADGKRIFYSGDFRAHGRKRKLFDGMIKSPPQGSRRTPDGGNDDWANRDERGFPDRGCHRERVRSLVRGNEWDPLRLDIVPEHRPIVTIYRARQTHRSQADH